MYHIDCEDFQKIAEKAITSLPKPFVEHLDNIAILVEDLPTLEQRRQLELRNDQTLFGLYEGVPLVKRQGTTKLLPDKITLFQIPLEQFSGSLAELRSRISRTVWHEVAHYYGLDHDQINKLQAKEHFHQ